MDIENDVIDQETAEDRESVNKFLKTIASEYKYEQVLIVGKSGEVVDAMWYGDNLAIHTLACIGKKSIWNILTGKGKAEQKDIVDKKEQDWDMGSLTK